SRGAIGRDGTVIDGAIDLIGDRGGDRLRRRVAIGHPSAGAVSLQAVTDVEVLLEVVLEWEVEERPTVGRQLHRCGQAALDDRDVASGKMAVEVVHVWHHLEPGMGRQRRGVYAGPGDDDHA